MFRFFRLIRQNLISNSKFKQYLLYSIGEIFLVVIGILIALQINNWNINKQNLRIEKTYLDELREDLISDSVTLQNIIQKSVVSHIEYAEYVLEFMDSGILKDTLMMTQKLIQAGYMTFFDSNQSTYNELINSGSLKLLRSKELKRLLDQYISYNKQIEKRYEVNKQVVWFNYGEYLKQEYIDGRLYGEIFNDLESALKKYPIDWNKLQKDRILYKKLTFIISSAKAERRWHQSTLSKVNEIVSKIDTLLKN